MTPLFNEPLPMYPGALELGEEEQNAVLSVLKSRRLFRYYGAIDGPSEVASYEKEWSEHFGVSHSLAVNSGTSALMCALTAVGVKRGDEVIVPSYTWGATAAAVVAVGAVPVIAEIDDSLTIDPSEIERKATAKTRAVMPVHMRGAPCDMDSIMKSAARAGIAVVEDAAQAVGASYNGARLGSIGDVGCYSTQYAKLITTGEGGVVVTNSASTYEILLDAHDGANGMRRNGQPSDTLGFSFRCSEITAAIGRVQLRRLDGIIDKCRNNAENLRSSLVTPQDVTYRLSNDQSGDAGIALVLIMPSVQQAQRAAVQLRNDVIGASVLHSKGTPDMHIYSDWRGVWKHLESDGIKPPELPDSVDLLARSLHIDVHPGWTTSETEAVAKRIESAL